MSELVERLSLRVILPEKVPSRGWLVVAGCFVSGLVGPALVASTFSVFYAALFVAALLASLLRNERLAAL